MTPALIARIEAATADEEVEVFHEVGHALWQAGTISGGERARWTALIEIGACIVIAMGVVPEGWEWQVSNRAPKPKAGRGYIHNRELIYAGIGGMRKNPAHRSEEETAATPALALLAAALKARQAQEHG